MINIEFVPTLGNLVTAAKLYHLRSPFRFVDRVVGALLLIVGAVHLWATRGGDWLGWVFIAVGVLELLDRVPHYAISALVEYWVRPMSKAPRAMQVYDDYFQCQINGLDSKIEWSFYDNYIEGDTMMLLVYQGQQYSAIPQSGCASEDDWQAFTALVRRNLPAK